MNKSLQRTLQNERTARRLRGTVSGITQARSQVPIIGIAVAWGLGVASGTKLDESTRIDETITAACMIVMIATATLMNHAGRVRLCRVMILCMVSILGMVHAHISLHTMTEEHHRVTSWSDRGLVHMEGTVALPSTSGVRSGGLLGAFPFDRTFHDVLMRDVTLIDTMTGESVSCSDVKVKIQATRDDVIGIIPGDRCKARARVLEARDVTNPGCERRTSIEPALLIEHPSMIDVVRHRDEPPGWSLHSIHRTWMEIVSEGLSKSIDWCTDENDRRLIHAIVLGERDDEFEKMSHPFRRTGTAHYLAVSGFAIGVLAAIPALLFRGRRGVVRTFCMLAFLALGMSAIDLRSPAIRSGAGIILATLGFSFGRDWSRMGLLALTSIVMLGCDPGAILDPGFQLSFVVVAALMKLTPHMARILPILPGDSGFSHFMNGRFTRDTVACGTVAWLCACPLVLHHFGIISPVGIMASIVLMPFMAVMISSSIIAITLSTMTTSLSWIPGGIAGVSIKMIGRLTELMDSFPGSFFIVPEWSPFIAVGFEILIWRWFLQDSRTEKMVLMIATFVITALAFIPGISTCERNGMRLVTMDMGDGTCHLLMTDRSSFLFDGGSMGKRTCGRDVILPVLRHHGVRRLDGVVISHANMDHFSGLAEIIGRIPIDRFIVGESFHATSDEFRDGAADRMLDLMESWRIPCSIVHAGDDIAGSDVVLSVHHPPRGVRYPRENDNSLVISATRGDGGGNAPCVLFTGDIEESAMKSLIVGMDGVSRIDVLEAPHHGSIRRSSEEFISMIDPTFLVQSTGPMRLRRDHLSEIMNRRPGITRFNTSTHGSIRIDLEDSGHLDVFTAPDGRFEPR